LDATKKTINYWPIVGWVAVFAAAWLIGEFNFFGAKDIHVWRESDIFMIFVGFIFLYYKLDQILDKMKEFRP